MDGNGHRSLSLAAAERDADRFYGKYRGMVLDNEDPMGIGRLRAIVPEVLGTVPSGWATPCVPYAGTGAGLYAIPDLGAGVWIEFEAGDPSRPIWVGSWWGRGEVPVNEQGTPSRPTRKILRSEFGLLVSIDDAEEAITISDASGANLIKVLASFGTIEIKSSDFIVMDASVIDHGFGAVHPAVLGDDLLAYLNDLVAAFNAHVHPGELAMGILPVTPAPPVPPFPPATPDLLSTKNFME